jgi:hypothetical protein
MTSMYSGLDVKYQKIAQLKEEFNEIKTLFGIKEKPQVSARKQEETVENVFSSIKVATE